MENMAKMTFDQRFQVWEKAPAGSEIKKTALEMIKGFEQTFEQWLRVWWLSWKSTGTDSESSKIRETALEKMKGLAQTLDQWLQVWEKAPEGSKTQKIALEKMKGLSRFFK